VATLRTAILRLPLPLPNAAYCSTVDVSVSSTQL